MKYKNSMFFASLVLGVALCPAPGFAAILETAEEFGVLGYSTVTNTGSSNVDGDLGLSPGPSVSGFAASPANTVVEGSGSTGLIDGPGLVSGTIHISDGVALNARNDAIAAWTGLQAMPFTENLTGQDLGNMTLTSGVYHFDSIAQLTGPLTLDGQGSSVAFWVFQVGSTLTTASDSSVTMTNEAANSGVFWQVGSSATLGTNTAFIGNILANNDITLTTDADILCGSALALNGAVTMDSNIIKANCALSSGGLEFSADGSIVAMSGQGGGGGPAAPEPVSMSLFALGAGALAARKLRRKKDAQLKLT